MLCMRPFLCRSLRRCSHAGSAHPRSTAASWVQRAGLHPAQQRHPGHGPGRRWQRRGHTFLHGWYGRPTIAHAVRGRYDPRTPPIRSSHDIHTPWPVRLLAGPSKGLHGFGWLFSVIQTLCGSAVWSGSLRLCMTHFSVHLSIPVGYPNANHELLIALLHEAHACAHGALGRSRTP